MRELKLLSPLNIQIITHRDNLEIYLRLRNRLEDAIYEAESNGKQGA